ncbi:GDP-mannose 4,6-dehydratase [Gordonia phthalatica]|uniref:GDP-mannose 4,6-dehydratase n=1 Tax=Gordonia phthalatica TaxID=1136941 RepID=A0A0N9NFK3_9ACTN|nr:GDP-mannose 4,6-dehydratase [Gordonia phthalatica]ALG85849.1 hypothetical protein ACH46_16845 [Gordonia phthalatica]
MTGRRTALVTGAEGQDGTLLTRALLDAGEWDVVATHLGSSTDPSDEPRLTRVHCDLTDPDAARRLIADHRPTHVFHLASMSSVARSWAAPDQCLRVNAMTTVDLLQSCADIVPDVAFVNASSGEIFGDAPAPQNEGTPIAPASPYGIAKAAAHRMVQTFRARGLRASNAILYNHESVLRPTTFVTRKITSHVAAIAHGSREPLRLGDIGVERDWGWAPDYVDALQRIARHEPADDFVVATGVGHTLSEFVAAAFRAAGIVDWGEHTVTDPTRRRPSDPRTLVGDPRHIASEIGWTATVTFDEVVARLVDYDLSLYDRPLDGAN